MHNDHNNNIPPLFIPITTVMEQMGCSKRKLMEMERTGELPRAFNNVAYVYSELTEHLAKRKLNKKITETHDVMNEIDNNIASLAQARKNRLNQKKSNDVIL